MSRSKKFQNLQASNKTNSIYHYY